MCRRTPTCSHSSKRLNAKKPEINDDDLDVVVGRWADVLLDSGAMTEVDLSSEIWTRLLGNERTNLFRVTLSVRRLVGARLLETFYPEEGGVKSKTPKSRR